MVVDMQGKEGAEMMDAMIEMMEQNAGVHLQDDLLALMEPPLYFVEMASPGGTAEALGPTAPSSTCGVRTPRSSRSLSAP